ncbi:MAG: mannose-1-phosphate guanylyltransferase [Gemmatimonadetes bacterium]|nr:mannose-1-phosphate guanylyltransferase [Gemmatimonadota bacterium]MCC6773955.1 mannose-1-phosphate guanylyltransferase [Gemmatimonadaceae bacterium]
MPIGDTPPAGWTSFISTGTAGTLPAEQPAATGLLASDTAMWAIVFAGGIGSRFWPLSSPQRPKQLLRLVGERPLIAETVARLHPLVPSERTLVVTSADIAGAIHAAIPEIPLANMLVEPRPLGTAAALAWGAREVARRAGPNALLCALHADLAVSFPESFRHSLRQAAAVAAREELVISIGVRPSRPEVGFGYLVVGEPLAADFPLSAGGPAMVTRFVEKPDAAAAASLCSDGALWHSGVALARANVLLDALRTHTPEVAAILDAMDLRELDELATQVRSVSAERGLLERLDSMVVVPGEFGWDDVGTWASLRRARDLDDDGNGAIGDVHFVDASGNVVHAEQSTVVLYGVEGLLVVTLPGLTFVTTLDRAAELRPMIERLPDALRAYPPAPERP